MTEPTATDTKTRAAAAIAECRLIATMSEEAGRTTRRFLTPPVTKVHAHLRARMAALGMSVRVDAVGNLRGLWQPASGTSKRFVLGSHIDTVPDAGAFDGVLGVVLALELVEMARVRSLPLAIEVIAFSEEEGVRFGVPFLGSRAVAGRFDPALLDLRDSAGVSVTESIRNFGLDPGEIDAALLSDAATGFFEIHIEQGPVLEAEGLQLAVVTGIVGQTRCEVCFLGQANHAGTTPMAHRRDALTAAAEWICAVEAAAKEHNSGRDEIIATVGKIVAEPNAGNVIAGSVRVSLDVRSTRDSVREATVARLLDLAAAIAARRGLRCEAKRQMEQPAVPMDEQLTAYLTEALEAADFPVRQMPSGAGHDAMVMATRVPTAMLFLRSPGGISHHPAEAVREEDVETALIVGDVFLRRLATIHTH
ncbi:allantoate amidohydrolase [Acidicapsa acidisoli]|uniref:allantoate amidohydrolase n=1 Tax=Acidicapsa acidisoli TaxID=1615681 RepID=UPI0021DFA2D0|nr:allantoate amidohydrolase [Acidicapsa acidisoli]